MNRASTNNFVQAVDGPRNLFGGCDSQALSDSFHRQRTNLAHLNPRSFRKVSRTTLNCEGKVGARLFARKR